MVDDCVTVAINDRIWHFGIGKETNIMHKSHDYFKRKLKKLIMNKFRKATELLNIAP